LRITKNKFNTKDRESPQKRGACSNCYICYYC